MTGRTSHSRRWPTASRAEAATAPRRRSRIPGGAGIRSDETRIELLLLDADTAAYLSARRLHPTQRFTPQRDGPTRVTMTVRGTTELASRILSLGPYVRVVKPRALRDEVAAALTEAGRLYERPS